MFRISKFTFVFWAMQQISTEGTGAANGSIFKSRSVKLELEVLVRKHLITD